MLYLRLARASGKELLLNVEGWELSPFNWGRIKHLFFQLFSLVQEINDYCRGVGVTTDPNIPSYDGCACNGKYWSNGLTYIWDGNCGVVNRFNNKKMEEYYKEGRKGWDKGMTATIAIDCEKWKLVIWRGEEHLISVNLVKNKTYHPVLSCCSYDGPCDVTLVTS